MPRSPGSSVLVGVAALLIPVGPAHLAQGQDPDLLTFAQGTLFVSQTGLQSGSSAAALLAIDGDPSRMGLTVDSNGPVEFTYKLPALTTFHRFAIPSVVEPPGNATFVRVVTVSGSAEGPEIGHQVLATFELETHGPDEEVTEIVPELSLPVRWIRVRFEDGINIEAGDEGRTNIWFSELIGNGTQDPMPRSTAFDGRWEMRLTERLDLRGVPFEIHQEGPTISGCYGTVRFTGTVHGSIARATGQDDQGRPAAFIMVADEDGTIHASASINNGRFAARTAVSVPDPPSGICAELPSRPVACGTNVYVNFDLDSAVIRPESVEVLADIYARLVDEDAQQVSIVGHTSTEGLEEYNRALSEERAQAVVLDLVRRGYDAARLTAVGMGETQPLISPDSNESARALNRRVEISCQ